MIDSRRYPEAIQALDQYLGQHPKDPEVLHLYGIALSRSGDNTRAETIFRRMIEVAPGDDRGNYNLALTLIRLGRTEEARKWLKAALDANPSLDRARRRLEDLNVTASKVGQPSGITSQPMEAEFEERLGPGDLLRSGTRRLSSFAGHFVFAALLIVLGLALFLTEQPGRLDWLAGSLTFPSPQFFERQINVVQGQGLPVGVLREELENAQKQQALTSAKFDQLLIFLAFFAPIAGVLLIIYAILAASRTRYDVYERRINLVKGVLSRSRQSAWLFEIKGIELRQPIFLNLTRNAMLRIRLEDSSVMNIIGFGTVGEQERLWEELRNAALVERRVMKRWFV
nr:tetratricopeptide repeat protein [Adhaeribacter radiodurans]